MKCAILIFCRITSLFIITLIPYDLIFLVSLSHFILPYTYSIIFTLFAVLLHPFGIILVLSLFLPYYFTHLQSFSHLRRITSNSVAFLLSSFKLLFQRDTIPPVAQDKYMCSVEQLCYPASSKAEVGWCIIDVRWYIAAILDRIRPYFMIIQLFWNLCTLIEQQAQKFRPSGHVPQESRPRTPGPTNSAPATCLRNLAPGLQAPRI